MCYAFARVKDKGTLNNLNLLQFRNLNSLKREREKEGEGSGVNAWNMDI